MEELLLAESVVEEMPDGSDLRLTEEFERVWARRIDRIEYGDRALRWVAAIHEVDPDDLSIEEDADRFAILHDGSPIEEWPSRESFLAGVVAEPTLREWLPEERWSEFSADERREMAGRLLVFLEQCPSCGDPLEYEETTTDEETVRVRLYCPECEATIVSGTYR